MNKTVQNMLEHLDFAFQPIVNIFTGRLFAVEALLRGWKKAGCKSIQNIFNKAFKKKHLFQLDMELRKRAIMKFIELDHHKNLKLFYNLDNRILNSPDYEEGMTLDIINKLNLHPSNICLELSERQPIEDSESAMDILSHYKDKQINVALDDFGTGYSGLQVLYQIEPDFIKIDRFFIDSIHKDVRKKLFISHVVQMSHILGISVIAEGIETIAEYHICREIGCDYIQGFLIQQPVQDICRIQAIYTLVNDLSKSDKRTDHSPSGIVHAKLQRKPALPLDAELHTVLNTFKREINTTVIPVLNDRQESIGVISERNIKRFIYSPYGQDLLKNKTAGAGLSGLLTRCPQCDINTPPRELLSTFHANKESEGIIITENSKYLGFLSPHGLLQIANELELESARDQNPLTKLPGNHLIYRHTSAVLQEQTSTSILIYFDFDNFKPYNDKYGFRQGDRIILMFSETLKSYQNNQDLFLGHVGGDDFFACFSGMSKIKGVIKIIQNIQEKFARNVVAFYDREDQLKGYIKEKDRKGRLQKFPLMTVSAAILHLQPGHPGISPEEVSRSLSELKKLAKISPDHIALSTFPANESSDLLSLKHKSIQSDQIDIMTI